MAPDGSLLVGAGDSYAAAICASFLSGKSFTVFDPYSLNRSRSRARHRSVYIVSVSGETRSNVELSKALKGTADRTVAVTCNPSSHLARAADDVVEIPFRPPGKSPGIAAFTLTLLTLLKLGGVSSLLSSSMGMRYPFDAAFSRAKLVSRAFRLSRGGVTYLLGNNEFYGAAIYGAAKLFELLGWRAHPVLLEEFSHMELFSLSTVDTVNVISPAEDMQRAKLLASSLERGGYSSTVISAGGARAQVVERLYQVIFATQLAAIDAAARNGLAVPYFLAAPEKLRISDQMIYGRRRKGV